MTHTTVKQTLENSGGYNVAYHTIDITGSDGTNFEEYSPGATVGSGTPHGVSVVAQENAGYRVLWDHVNGRLHTTNADGTAFAAAGEVIGEVTLRVEWG